MKIAINIIRWIARILGIVLFLFFIGFAIHIGSPDLDLMTKQEIKLFFANLVMLVSLFIVWRFEFIGSILLISSYIFFSIVNYSFWTGPVFPFFLLIGIIHLFCWGFTTILKSQQSGFTSRFFFK